MDGVRASLNVRLNDRALGGGGRRQYEFLEQWRTKNTTGSTAIVTSTEGPAPCRKRLRI